MPQFTWPPALVELDGGGVTFATCEQDSDEELRSCINLLCDVRPGQLVWDRRRGTPSPLGSTDPEKAAAAIEVALAIQEPRASVEVQVVEGPDRQRRTRLRLIQEEL